MKRYVALLAPDGAPGDPDAWRLEREGFAALAIAFPVPWLVVKRLWLPALAVFAVPFAVGALLGPLPGLVASAASGLAVAWEGRNWRIAKLERRGWRYVAGQFARDRAEAEDQLAMLATRLANGDTTPVEPITAPSAPETARTRFSDRTRELDGEPYGPPAPPRLMPLGGR